jgi:serine protease inhibitor
VSGATNNQIEKVVEEDQLDELTRLIIVNAIYFKGEIVGQTSSSR